MNYKKIKEKYSSCKNKEEFEVIKKEIQEKCTPDEIYKYEFANLECGFTGDDSEALKIVKIYFKNYERP